MMEFAADRVQVVECIELAGGTQHLASEGCGVEFLGLELELPSAPVLVHEVAVQLRGSAASLPLLRHAALVCVDAARPAYAVVAPGGGALGRRSSRATVAVQDQMLPLVLSRPNSGPCAAVSSTSGVEASTAHKQLKHPKQLSLEARPRAQQQTQLQITQVSGAREAVDTPALTLRAYGVCKGRLRVTLQWTAPREGAEEMLRAVLAALPAEVAAPLGNSEVPILSFLIRHTLLRVRVETVPLVRGPVSAAHLIPLLNAVQHLRSAGPAHHVEASEAELLAGLALMRSRRFVQCVELWQRCSRDLLGAAGVALARDAEDEPSHMPDHEIPDLGACMPLGCNLSISPFAHRISASFDVGVQKAIAIQVLIAACAIEHSGGPLQDQNLGATLNALHLATRLHLADLQATPALKLRPLCAPYDAQTVLFSLRPHVVHVLCAVVNENLKSEAATQWRHIVASALRCLDFVVHMCISCAFEPLVIDTIVRCFDTCDIDSLDYGADSFRDHDPAIDSACEDGPVLEGHRCREDGIEDLRTALHHLVETCHDVLPSVSTGVLRKAAARLVERILGSQGQRNWPSLHVHLLRLLMRIVVLASGDAAPALVAGPGAAHAGLGFTGGGNFPFFDYLLRLLSAARAEERGVGSFEPVPAAGESNSGLGMPYVGHRSWDILRIHLLPIMPKRELRLFVEWVVCSLSDSRSSYPAAQLLLLAVITDLARAAVIADGESEAFHGATSICPDVSDAPPLRVHRTSVTVAGVDLQPLVRPLRDWLLLLISKRDCLRGNFPTFTPAEQHSIGQADVLARRPLSRGLLPASWIDDNVSDDVQTSAWYGGSTAEPPDQEQQQNHQQKGATRHWNEPASAPTGAFTENSWSADSRPRQIHVRRNGANPISMDGVCRPAQSQVVKHYEEENADMLRQCESGHAEQLLLVWSTLVAIVRALPTNCRPDLHVLARPLFEDMRQVCLQGSPPEEALRVTLRVLIDLEPCTEQTMPFIKDLLLAFCEWIPHSVFDETFSMLDEMLRLLGAQGVDDHVLRALIHSMLNQYTLRSKSHRQSQEAIIALLMARRKGAALNNAQQEMSSIPLRHTDRRDERQEREKTSADIRDSDTLDVEVEESANGDINHFEVVVNLCLLINRKSEPQRDDDGCDSNIEQKPSDELVSSDHMSQPSNAIDNVSLMGDLDLVERLQFMSAIFRTIRLPHLKYIIARQELFVESLRIYVSHPLEKVRLFAADLIQSICGAAFDRYIHCWAKAGSSADSDMQRQWWALLAQMVELACLPLTPISGRTLNADTCDAKISGNHVAPREGSVESSIGTPAVLLSCCRLVHLARLREFFVNCGGPPAGFPAKRLTACLAAPLLRLANAPWQLPRIAAISALLSWAPFLAWGDEPGACDLLEKALLEGLVCGDCLNRAAALRLLPTLMQHRHTNNALIPPAIRDAILALREDWSTEVQIAMKIVLPLLTSSEADLPSEDRAEFAAAATIKFGSCGSNSRESRGSPSENLGSVTKTTKIDTTGVAEPWGDVIWDSAVYVEKVPVVREGKSMVKRCLLDRFEDFLDACDRVCAFPPQRRPSMSMRYLSSSNAGEDNERPSRLDPDPELSRLFGGDGSLPDVTLCATELDADLGRLGSVSTLRSEELEDEEDLGIIDAGDEEWLEVLDVIRERSAVTIFNHTDSTWYVSSKHPSFVRPLHGKRRDPQQQYRQRSPSPSDLTVTSESRVSSPSVHPRRELRGDTTPRVRGHLSQDVGSCTPGDLASSSASLQTRLQRRPHSAPNPAQDRRLGGGQRGASRQEPPSHWPSQAGSSSGGIGMHAGRRPGSGSPRFGPMATPPLPRGLSSTGGVSAALNTTSNGSNVASAVGSAISSSRVPFDSDAYRRHYCSADIPGMHPSLYVGSATRHGAPDESRVADDVGRCFEGFYAKRHPSPSPPISEDDALVIEEEQEDPSPSMVSHQHVGIGSPVELEVCRDEVCIESEAAARSPQFENMFSLDPSLELAGDSRQGELHGLEQISASSATDSSDVTTETAHDRSKDVAYAGLGSGKNECSDLIFTIGARQESDLAGHAVAPEDAPPPDEPSRA